MPLCMPGVYCYSHSISRISDVRLRIKQRRVESRKASRPRAEPLNSLPTCDPAAEKGQEGPLAPAPGHGRSDSIASRCLSLRLPTNDHSGQERFVSSSLDPGSLCIFYNRMNLGPRYKFAPSLAFRGVTGDGACWSVTVPRNPGKVTQLWAALQGMKPPDSVPQSSTPIPTPAFQPSSSSGRIVGAVTPLGCQKAQDEKAELGGRRGAGRPRLGADLFCSEGPAFCK